MAQQTRLGLMALPMRLYGSFSGKALFAPLVVVESAISGLEKAAVSLIVFAMVAALDGKTPQYGKTVSVLVSKDGGSFAGATNTVSEVGYGVYSILLTAAETDADVVALCVSASNCASRIIPIYTDAITSSIRDTVRNKLTINVATSELELWNTAGSAIILTWPLTDKDGASISLTAGPPANRGVPT